MIMFVQSLLLFFLFVSTNLIFYTLIFSFIYNLYV